jgi:hypothetical protein
MSAILPEATPASFADGAILFPDSDFLMLPASPPTGLLCP